MAAKKKAPKRKITRKVTKKTTVKRAKKRKFGKRYSDGEKIMMCKAVNEFNAKSNGRGGIAHVARVNKVSPLSIQNWMKNPTFNIAPTPDTPAEPRQIEMPTVPPKPVNLELAERLLEIEEQMETLRLKRASVLRKLNEIHGE